MTTNAAPRSPVEDGVTPGAMKEINLMLPALYLLQNMPTPGLIAICNTPVSKLLEDTQGTNESAIMTRAFMVAELARRYELKPQAQHLGVLDACLEAAEPGSGAKSITQDRLLALIRKTFGIDSPE